ncbi:MAG TPA: citryl-CoA lyase [Jiangellaceae bacterium]|nr:citryl-CoA lyase [Jiangellaceae bacterium]
MTGGTDHQHDEVADWWASGIIRIEPGVIEYRGEPIAEVIAGRGLADVIWLLLRSGRPTPAQARLLEAAMVASADHGPQAPSIAAARMAATCGVGLNNAVATGVNMLGDVHGGAGEQCLTMLSEVVERESAGQESAEAARATVQAWRAEVRFLPGFGHRFHPVDPRREPLITLVAEARDKGEVSGAYLRAGLAIEAELMNETGKNVPMNVDGLTAIIYGELGFAAPLARGLFVLSRAVGILAHAWEESQSGRRIKGPMPPSILPSYLPSAES